ncbi:unnamed protein product [Lepeophtheirus salmonis]|uniref:(salmon louse) hypothetical protein n=1 Tax=Lepeophtheirus salmonis TaxID=72036 RepID=A0A7R8CHD9_LEPSM|nr:unnamed protein product [Lepeophtheirus salmonis]CAF2823547.1 unnamed protein product [Lepeophtheirus salmonis]
MSMKILEQMLIFIENVRSNFCCCILQTLLVIESCNKNLEQPLYLTYHYLFTRQLFCGTHSTLEFPSSKNKRLSIIKRDMTLEAIFKNLIGDLDFDTNQGSVSGHSLDCMLLFMATEYYHKP